MRIGQTVWREDGQLVAIVCSLAKILSHGAHVNSQPFADHLTKLSTSPSPTLPPNCFGYKLSLVTLETHLHLQKNLGVPCKNKACENRLPLRLRSCC